MMSEKEIDDWVPHPINIVNFENYRTSTSHNEIVEEEEEEEVEDEYDDGGFKRRMPSIREEECSNDMFLYGGKRSEVVYVVTWRGTDELLSASMDALLWTLGNRHESSIVYLVHVFPELRYIPTPLGMLPVTQANKEHKEAFVSQERSKRSEYLRKFLSICSSSKVEVETVLIESDMEAKAILDLIPILNIRKLVLGATKSTLKKLKHNNKRGIGGTLDVIVHNAPDFCDVKVICEGKEVSLLDPSTSEPPSPSSRATDVNSVKSIQMVQQNQTNDPVKCSCFKL